MPEATRRRFVQKCVNLIHELNRVKEQGLPIVYCDETLFGKRTLVQKEWAGKNSNLSVSQTEACSFHRNVIASMTEEGIFHIQIQQEACVALDFSYYIHVLSQKMNGRPFALFMDNASIHREKELPEEYAKLKITTVFNVPYSPEFNPIEAVFSKVKRVFSH